MAETAKKTAAAKAAPEKPMTSADIMRQKVPVTLFKDGKNYKEDVFVSVNGKAYQIKRGVEVMVPRFVAEVLMRSHAQDIQTAELIDAESSKWEAKAKAINL